MSALTHLGEIVSSARGLAVSDAYWAQELPRLEATYAAVAELIETLKMVDRIWSSDQTANLDPNSPKAKVRRALAYVGARHD